VSILDAREILELSPSRLKLLLIELQKKLAALEGAAHEPIAIIGIAGRYPTTTGGIDAFWQTLLDRRVVGQDESATGSGPVRRAGLANVDRFDAAFFDIASQEAHYIDPQHRLLMEVAWEAMENAGRLPPDFGGRAGTYLALCSTDYADLVCESPGGWEGYLVRGNSHGMAAGRLAKKFGLTGPCMAVDSTCSSSLLAAHIAVGHLRSRECDIALVGGVSVILSPKVSLDLREVGLLSPSGRCRPFDANADGYVRGEGCGVLLLKRLSDALQDQDPIIAIIRGSATNHDGGGGVLTPNGPAQRQVIRAALEDAKIDAEAVGYIEASSVGAMFADPVEAEAISSVYGQSRSAGSPVVVGSVKANIGHLEAAAGVAALSKTALCLDRQAIPAHATFETLSPLIDWDAAHIRIPRDTEMMDGRLQFAAVSAFSLSGTNVHLILEKPPEQEAKPLAREACVLPLSARDPAALDVLTSAVIAHLEARPDDWPHLAYTLAVGRKHMPLRRAVVAYEAADAIAKLKQAGAGSTVACTAGRNGASPAVGFLFAPSISASAEVMALAEHAPLVKQSLTECGKALNSMLGRDQAGFPLADAPASVVSLAIQIALASLVASFGVKPSLVGGAGIGEIAAAVVAKLLDIPDAIGLAMGSPPASAGVPVRIKFGIEDVPIISNVTGRPAAQGEIADEAYWTQATTSNRSAVFDNVAHALAACKLDAAVVFGAMPNLLRDTIPAVATPGAQTSSGGIFAALAADLYLLGCGLDWRGALSGKGYRVIAAPTTEFARDSFWIDSGHGAPSGVIEPPWSIDEPHLNPMTAEEATTEFLTFLQRELMLEDLRSDQNLLFVGATSVDVIRVITRVEQKTGFRPRVEDLFRDPTVDGIVRLYIKFLAERTRLATSPVGEGLDVPAQSTPGAIALATYREGPARFAASVRPEMFAPRRLDVAVLARLLLAVGEAADACSLSRLQGRLFVPSGMVGNLDGLYSIDFGRGEIIPIEDQGVTGAASENLLLRAHESTAFAIVLAVTAAEEVEGDPTSMAARVAQIIEMAAPPLGIGVRSIESPYPHAARAMLAFLATDRVLHGLLCGALPEDSAASRLGPADDGVMREVGWL
jgi:acyl transferase domain-containing protein